MEIDGLIIADLCKIMLVDMSETPKSRKIMSTKRQGVVYNGNDQMTHLVDFPSPFATGGYVQGRNGEDVSNLMSYEKEDETRKSTGSIHNILPTPEFIHIRSSSDTSEIALPGMVSSRINEEKNGKRPSSGDSFSAIIQRFENASFQGQLGQKLNNLTKKGNDRTDWGTGSKEFKSPLTSGTASPATDKRVYLNLKRKGSLKASASRREGNKR